MRWEGGKNILEKTTRSSTLSLSTMTITNHKKVLCNNLEHSLQNKVCYIEIIAS